MYWDDRERYEQMRRDTKAAIARQREEILNYTWTTENNKFEANLTEYDKEFLAGLKISIH